MRSASFPSIGTLNETLPDEDDPIYQVANLSLSVHKILKNLSDNGFVFEQAVTTDVSTWITNMQDAVDNYVARYEDFLQTGSTAVSAALPDLLSLAGVLLGGGTEAILPVLMQGLLDVVLRHKDTRTGEYGGDTAEVDTAAIIDKLEEIREQIESVLNQFTINIMGDLQSQTWSVEPAPEE